MKKISFVLIMIIVYSFLNSSALKSKWKEWETKWFSITIPYNWESPTPVRWKGIRYNDDSLKYHLSIRATPPKRKAGIFKIKTFVNGHEKSTYRNMWKKDSLKLKVRYTFNNIQILKKGFRKAIRCDLTRKDKEFQQRFWYIQTRNKIFVISFGSNSKKTYKKYIKTVDSMVNNI